MYILYLFEAVYIAYDRSLEKKGLECAVTLATDVLAGKPVFTPSVEEPCRPGAADSKTPAWGTTWHQPPF